MRYLELEAKVLNKLKAIDKVYIKAFGIAFALVNLTFLFHSVNFMFGDHDWTYVRGEVAWNEGTFEGRPLHFLLQGILFNGAVLPFLNNLISFAALTLSAVMLAYYWRVPKTVLNYTLFATFSATLPLTLVWLYYTKDTLINLSLPLIAISGIMCAAKAYKERNFWLHITSVVLFFWAFGAYVAVVEFLGIVLLGSFLINWVMYKERLFSEIKEKFVIGLDAMVAAVGYIIVLKSSDLTSDYNTKTIGLDYMPQKFGETLEVMFTQFVTPIPFMEYKFKLLLLALVTAGFVALLIYGGFKKFPFVAIGAALILFISKFAFFIADERGQRLAELENFAFVPRLDFYGLNYIYALGLAIVLSVSAKRFYKAGVAVAVIITFMSGVRDMYAQKVWKLGFDAEMKAHERIITRIEQHPAFHPNANYRILQLGNLALRKNYYRKQTGEETSLDLLTTSYTPLYMSHIVYNFNYPKDIFLNNAFAVELSAKGRDFILNQAKPWPSHDSLFFDGDIIIVVIDQAKLDDARAKLR